MDSQTINLIRVELSTIFTGLIGEEVRVSEAEAQRVILRLRPEVETPDWPVESSSDPGSVG